MRELGYRITSQRKYVVSALLENPNSTCKELSFFLKHQKVRVSQASIYRTIKELESLGFMRRQGVILSSCAD